MKRGANQPTPSGAGVNPSLARPGGLTYLEIPATDVNASAHFYANVLGWKSPDTDSDPSKFSDPAGKMIGRFVLNRSVSRKPGLLPYVYINAIDEAVKRATQFGGDVVTPVRPEGNLRVAVVRDPAGNGIGLWQAAES